MKRVADKQLIKDGGDESDGEEGAQGFRKADESALATRKIRGLPKRSQPSATPATSTGLGMAWAPSPASAPAPAEEPAPVSKFAGFTGFGAPSTSKPFSFAPQSSSTSNASTASSTTTATGASSAAKTFASFLGGPSNGAAFKTTPISSEEDNLAVKYYTSLRGLNVSFLKAINQYVEEDPFVDISELLERYKNLRNTIQKDFDATKSDSTANTNATPAPPTAPPNIFTMPTQPASTTTTPSLFGGSSFLAPSSSSEDKSAPSTGGFSFKPTTNSSSTSSPFILPGSAAKPSDSPSTPAFSFTPSNTTSSGSSTGGLTFGAPKDTSSSSGGFTFGASTKSIPSASSSAPSSLPFSLAPPKSIFGDKSKDEEMKEEKPATATPSNPFGISSSSSSSSGAFGSFSFGKPSAPASSLPSSSNPISFGFGSSVPTGESKPSPLFGGTSFPSAPSTTTTSTGGFSFGGPSAISSSDKKEAAGEVKQEEGVAAGSTDAAAGPPAMFGVNPHDTEGEGEENEETVHAIKSKAYRMKKADEKGGPGWVEIGYGILRLKKHKETGARRMLLRNSTTGKININFALYSNLKPSVAKKAITFIGHDDGVAQTYSVRVGTEGQAKELKEALDREITFVKAKHSD